MSGCWFLALEAGSWHSSSSRNRRPSSHQQPPAAAAWQTSRIQIIQQEQQEQQSSSRNSRSQTSFLVGFQKGRSGLRGACSCEWFCVIFGTKLGGVLLFRVGFEKDVWLLVSCLQNGNTSPRGRRQGRQPLNPATPRRVVWEAKHSFSYPGARPCRRPSPKIL